MIRRGVRGRAGITLTEILISIMIMGVGLVSLATLFPLGLLRLRAAAVRSRSAFLVESAEAEMATRNLLARSSFLIPSVPWHCVPLPFVDVATTPPYDPWIQDTPAYPATTMTNGVYRGWGGIGVPNPSLRPYIDGPGLVVAYDPLWRATSGIYLGSTVSEARFASGLGSIRADPAAGGLPSAHGLQRITNFPATATVVPSIFVSPDDPVLQTATGANGAVGSSSPIVPEMYLDPVDNLWKYQSDWMYSWMFTGRRTQATNGTEYVGDIVIFHGRPLTVDGTVAAGETVVEAVFGYSTRVPGVGNLGTVGYGVGGDRVVLLRWPATTPDPEVRVGNWIADVTYERVGTVDTARQTSALNEGINVSTQAPYVPPYPYQRCHWYQVVKKAEVPDPYTTNGSYRAMTVVVHTPVRAKTLLYVANPQQPYHVNAALVSRYVVNVFPKTFTTR